MPAVEAPVQLVESLAELRFPPRADACVRSLMDRNTNGELTAEERNELAGWVELSERMALLRAQALHLLGRVPV